MVFTKTTLIWWGIIRNVFSLIGFLRIPLVPEACFRCLQNLGNVFVLSDLRWLLVVNQAFLVRQTTAENETEGFILAYATIKGLSKVLQFILLSANFTRFLTFAVVLFSYIRYWTKAIFVSYATRIFCALDSVGTWAFFVIAIEIPNLF